VTLNHHRFLPLNHLNVILAPLISLISFGIFNLKIKCLNFFIIKIMKKKDYVGISQYLVRLIVVQFQRLVCYVNLLVGIQFKLLVIQLFNLNN